MTFKRYRILLPTWAIGYLVMGDPSGLEDDEVTMVDDWAEAAKEDADQLIIDIPVPLLPDFSTEPIFGLPCDVVVAEYVLGRED